jgi:hypothetical protein
VPHPTDKSAPTPSPDPELNPLMNPLLGAHMGRWAEVYFTNPPEKRDQAVSELLRELENLAPPEPASVQSIVDETEGKGEAVKSANWSPSTLKAGRTCTACAYHNSAEKRFCGMCGAPLQVSPEVDARPVAEGGATAGESGCERILDADLVEGAIAPAVSSATTGDRNATLELSSLFPEKGIPHLEVESKPLFNRHRLYLGAVLAILLFVLGYTARRRPQVPSGTAASLPAPAIPYAQQAPADSAQPPSATRYALPASDPLSSEPRTIPAAASSAAVVAAPGSEQPRGAEELAMAEKYLNGTSGMNRDSGEAAEWLWKAVRKRNVEATLVLSDLYLRGDGVAKSCDQARLLLDAAARKGGKAAAERLRNLQAFGCE